MKILERLMRRRRDPESEIRMANPGAVREGLFVVVRALVGPGDVFKIPKGRSLRLRCEAEIEGQPVRIQTTIERL